MADRITDNSLQAYNTFGIDVSAKDILKLSDVSQLDDIANLESALFIGGGSNVLFTEDINQLVILNQTKGIQVVHEDEHHIELEVASGENWHEFVIYCVNQGYGGIENLSLIPGSVGAAPMQNIGAYGVEIKDVLVHLVGYNIKTKEKKSFSNQACNFGYRESIFKKAEKGNYFIDKVVFRLTKKNHQLNTNYGAIKDVLSEKQITNPTIKDISDVVIEIRQSKLPDPKDLGNAGSFFKNPVIEKSHFDKLIEEYPSIKSYPIDDKLVKIPAGWLIESLGWKGKRIGNTGSHAKQALVLVNYGGVKGSAVKKLSEDIKESVWEAYAIRLETEVNIL